MELENRSRYLWSYRSLNDLFKNLCFVTSTDNDQNLFASHDCTDSHSISLTWNVCFAFEEAFVCLNRSFCQIYTMRFVFKVIRWFIETDMTIVAKTENLNVSRTDFVKQLIVSGACFFCILFVSVRNVGI